MADRSFGPNIPILALTRMDLKTDMPIIGGRMCTQSMINYDLVCR